MGDVFVTHAAPGEAPLICADDAIAVGSLWPHYERGSIGYYVAAEALGPPKLLFAMHKLNAIQRPSGGGGLPGPGESHGLGVVYMSRSFGTSRDSSILFSVRMHRGHCRGWEVDRRRSRFPADALVPLETQN